MTARLRCKQFAAWLILAVFLSGFFYHPIGAWTGPILGTWFVGTQRPLRGFMWMFVFTIVAPLFANARLLAGAGFNGVTSGLEGLILSAAVSALPYLLYRLAIRRFSDFAATLSFPVFSVAISLVLAAKPALGLRVPANLGPGWIQPPSAHTLILLFARTWLASSLVWAWSRGFRFQRLGSRSAPLAWRERNATIALLRSPSKSGPLKLVCEGRREFLAGASGERFSIRGGIPDFLRPEDLTGANRKYNQLYETIGGFYDDSQRVLCALAGMDRDAYVMGYMGLLEAKPGDLVLETSVGTGLNFKYLPRGIRRYGLDLSAAMLYAAGENLRRWRMDADLFLGNAEALPFADSSFDIVFHVGGINFFSDRAAAIREMIRVAKPGTLLLVADETEDHVKAAYENIPYTREFFKGRAEAVAAPLDLLPPEMEEVCLNVLEVAGKKRFYVLTFRKPAAAASHLRARTGSVSALS